MDNTQTIIGEFTGEVKRRNTRIFVVLAGLAASNLLLLGLIEYLIPILHIHHWLLKVLIALQLLIPIVISCFLVMPLTKASRGLQVNMARLAASKDVRAISPLLALSSIRNRNTRRLVGGALTSLLPHLQERDLAWLTNDDVNCILLMALVAKSGGMRRLYGHSAADLVVAVLHAVGEIGDKRILDAVTVLAKREAPTDADLRIQEAARECLTRLQARIERDCVGQHLLRSSAPPEKAVDTLLIPAVEPTDVAACELPRPSALK
jgi:hypothetical protein